MDSKNGIKAYASFYIISSLLEQRASYIEDPLCHTKGYALTPDIN
jgi:hypothetical protein